MIRKSTEEEYREARNMLAEGIMKLIAAEDDRAKTEAADMIASGSVRLFLSAPIEQEQFPVVETFGSFLDPKEEV